MEVKERPTLFSAPMVKAILEGKKTQTRRVVKLREFQRTETRGYDWTFRDRRALWNDYTTDRLVTSKHNPYGAPGDKLWVREAWSHDAPDLDACRSALDCCSIPGYGPYYRATEVAPDTLRWISPLFMPRWASRITLEITDVRVQRLQEISEDDARAEGVEPYTPPHGHISPEQRVPGPGFDRCRLGDQPHRLPFADLWDRINGKHAPWGSNPWVWCVSFRRIAP